MDSQAQSLIDNLLVSNREEQVHATQHAFLKGVGDRTLPPNLLSRWLVQDKYYQCAYVGFVSRLIAKLDLGVIVGSDKQNSLEWKTFETLFSALEAIKVEIDFYDETVSNYKLELDVVEANEVTKQYIQLFETCSSTDSSLLEGMVVLWATEYVYLQAWTYAKQQASSSARSMSDEEDNAMLALHKEFIPNWTSKEFEAAVSKLAEIVEAWHKLDHSSEVIKACHGAWLRVLHLEARFWPEI